LVDEPSVSPPPDTKNTSTEVGELSSSSNPEVLTPASTPFQTVPPPLNTPSPPLWVVSFGGSPSMSTLTSSAADGSASPRAATQAPQIFTAIDTTT